MHGAAVGAEVPALEADPKLDDDGGLLRPGASGAAVDAAVKCDVKVTTDIDGQARPKSGADVGAGEVSGATGEITLVPLDPSKVGVDYFHGDGPK